MPVEWNGDEIVRRIRAAAARGVLRGTEAVVTEATRLIQSTSKSGRTYRRRGVEHVASAPGEAPATDTGTLVKSNGTETRNGGLTGIAKWSAAHAPSLEYGTSRIEPRPFARPALANKRLAIEEDIKKEIKRALT